VILKHPKVRLSQPARGRIPLSQRKERNVCSPE
jgi:hypothetical protein